MYQNGQRKLFENAKDLAECIKVVEKHFSNENKTLKQGSSDYSIRIYFVEIDNSNKKEINVRITKVLSSGKPQKKETGVLWDFNGKFEGIEINIQLIDNKDIVYTIWDLLEVVLEKQNKDIIDKLEFKLNVQSKGKGYTEKQKLILFFSKKVNYGKLWKYSDLTKAMRSAGLEMAGRGIEGERAREFRYELGYPFITSEQDKNVPDGFCRVDLPFPTLMRNERRNADVNLEKADWSELLELLKKEPEKLRCFECGLFEGETNKIGQKTKFEKGHLQTHLSGGNVSQENITAICKYCNSKQKDIYSYDPISKKKIFHIIPFLKNKKISEKKEAFEYLLKHLKKDDVNKMLK